MIFLAWNIYTVSYNKNSLLQKFSINYYFFGYPPALITPHLIFNNMGPNFKSVEPTSQTEDEYLDISDITVPTISHSASQPTGLQSSCRVLRSPQNLKFNKRHGSGESSIQSSITSQSHHRERSSANCSTMRNQSLRQESTRKFLTTNKPSV